MQKSLTATNADDRMKDALAGKKGLLFIGRFFVKIQAMNIKMYIKAVVFMLLVAMGIELSVRLLYPMNDIVRNWHSFYGLEKQSVDVLIIGSSHAFCSFDTALFEENTGKNAYILASNSQNAVQGYFNVKEALKYQKPETIILEAFSLDSNDWRGGGNDDKDWKKESNIDGMRLGLVKLEAVREQYLPKNWAYALFPLARCHKNWADASQIYSNYAFFRSGIGEFSPFRPSQSVMSDETMKLYAEAEKSTSELYISESNVAYFHKLAELCRDEGIALQVVMVPMYDAYIDSINYSSWTDKILALAESEGVEYLDCNLYYDEIGLSAQDFEDAYTSYHHLNAAGAKRVTNFVEDKLYATTNGI